MISRTEIRRLCNSSAYFKGMDLYHQGKIEEFSVWEQEEEDFIDAVVEGSGQNSYSVQITCRPGENKVAEAFCECPAYESYPGICKHCVAVLLAYLDEKKNSTEREKRLPRASKTTRELKELLIRKEAERTAPILQRELYEKVRLEPYLQVSEGGISISFKIGTGQMYVLKDIFAFAQNMETGREAAYGKKLQFVHVPKVFEPKSAKLAAFLVQWSEENRNLYRESAWYGNSYGYVYQKLKEISLSAAELAKVLEILQGTSVSVKLRGQDVGMWEITEKSPKRSIELSGEAMGLRIRTERLLVFRDSQWVIYFQDQKIFLTRHQEGPEEELFFLLQQLPGQCAFLEKEDVPDFCREYLPAVQKEYSCVCKNFDPQEYTIEPVSFAFYLDALTDRFLTIKGAALYGEEKFNLFDKKTGVGRRDFIEEARAELLVTSWGNAYDEKRQCMVLAEDENKIYEFLTEGIPMLGKQGEVYVSEALKRMKVLASPRISVGISLSSGALHMAVSSETFTREELAEILSRYDKKKRYYRLKNGTFLNMEGGLKQLWELKESLGLLRKQLLQENITLPAYRALYLDGEFSKCEGLQVKKDRNFKALIRNMKTIEDNDFELPKSLEGIFREYQKTGFLWLKTLKTNGFGGILADEMGLGKTLQVIGFLLSEMEEAEEGKNKSCLIVCPASLVFNWISEFQKFAPDLCVKAVTGNSREREEILKHCGEKDILVTSYDLLKRDILCYEAHSFAFQILDEAQYIKNHGTQAAKAAKEVSAAFRLALTGTPVENRLSELWSIFDYLLPGFLYSYEHFRKEIEIPIVQRQEEEVRERLKKMVSPFLLRRVKKDVLKDLPEKIEKNLYATMEGEQKELYHAHAQRLKMMLGRQTEEEFRSSRIQVLSELTRLRQLCCCPALVYEGYEGESSKEELCMELIRQGISSGHRILLFSQFVTMLERLEKKLEEQGISYYSLTGSTGKRMRSQLVRDFQEKDEAKVFCISLKAGGTGLNLTAADMVIHYDPWWNQAVQDQATDRVHRIGQKNPVTVYRLLEKDTIEERIQLLQGQKKNLAEELLSGEDMSSSRFNRQELLELLV